MKFSNVYRLVRLGAFLCVSLLVLWYVKPFSWFLPSRLLVNQLGFSRAFYDSRGELLRVTLSSDEKFRLWTPLKEISGPLIQATLTQEDRFFFYHPGVQPIALLRSLWINLFHGARAGGSTITMQVARMRYGLYTRTISGKLIQCVVALGLETLFSKEEILEAYLNLAPYGGNIEGVGAASLVYFQKKAAEISSFEALTLVVIPQRPASRILWRDTGKQAALVARERLLERVSKDPILPNPSIGAESLGIIRAKTALPFTAPHFTQRIDSDLHGASLGRTSLNGDLQRLIERIVAGFVTRSRKLGIKNASVLLVERPSMKVRAYVGSADFWNRDISGQVDGVRARRSPGSALKPFIYGLAMDDGLIHPGSVLGDTPFSRAQYNPENFDREFVGPISATDALIRSRNTPAVTLLNQLSPERFHEFLRKAQVKDLRSASFYGLSLALGGVEVRMDELVALYGIIANKGWYTPLSFTARGATSPQTQLLSPESAFLVARMLEENPRPPTMVDSEWATSRIPVAWKTGTSFGFRDAWAVGIFGDYILGVWIGNFDNVSNPAFIGRDAAGPLFFNIVDAVALTGSPSVPSPDKTPGVKRVSICAVSGELPGPHCERRRTSWFIPGRSPIKTCTVHRKVLVDSVSGLRMCSASTTRGGSRIGIEKVFEFWPTHILNTLAQSGIPRVRPPEWAPECAGDRIEGFSPLIVSPDPTLTYQLTTEESSIALLASSDGESRRVFWFADDSFVGTQEGMTPLLWRPHSGTYLLRAIDDQGRAQSVTVTVG